MGAAFTQRSAGCQQLRASRLRTTASAGHGIGTALDEEIEQGADVFSFLFDQLGIKYAAAERYGGAQGRPVTRAISRTKTNRGHVRADCGLRPCLPS